MKFKLNFIISLFIILLLPQASYSWDGWYKATVKHDDISEKRFRGMSKNKDKAIEQAIASCEQSNKNSAHKCLF